MTANDAPPHPAPQPKVSVHPILGVLGVLLGACIATLLGRLLSVGLADLRGGMSLGSDEASWIGTSFNAAMMFIGPFSVYLGGLLGPRRVLLTCAAAFTLISVAMAFTHSLPVLLILLVCAGLTGGTFYPLTLSFVLRALPMNFVLLGIAAYGVDVVISAHVATWLEAWYVQHLSWHWIFWNGVVLTPIMMLLVHFGIPPQPLPRQHRQELAPSWAGFLYASLGFALAYVALDQGQRLNWFGSGTEVALAMTGALLLLLSLTRRARRPNPLINLRFLLRRNIVLLALCLIMFRFDLLATLVAVPSYLSSLHGYLPLQTGPVLLWDALPQLLWGITAIYLLRVVDARLVMATGFTLTAIACIMNAHLSSAWTGSSFLDTQLLIAVGQALAVNGLVGSIILEVVNSGALTRPIDVLTFSAFMHTVRILGGEIGVAFLQRVLDVREKFHSNILGLNVHPGSPAVMQRFFGLTAGVASGSPGPGTAAGRAAEILSLQIRGQAFTMAVSDAFTVFAWVSIACLCVIACMGRVKTQYRQILANPAAAVAAGA